MFDVHASGCFGDNHSIRLGHGCHIEGGRAPILSYPISRVVLILHHRLLFYRGRAGWLISSEVCIGKPMPV